ncbi:MAG: hypothetical protein ACRC28_10910 [Clostridium sp.]|uniref:hypothetical protein n=1 Tax=Clostridium sp. TaxID=1506 RepID=UPI003F36381F
MERLNLEYEKNEFDLEKLIEKTLEKETLKIDEKNKIIAILDKEKIYLGNRKEKIKKEIKWIYENNFNKKITLIIPYDEKMNLEVEIKEKVKVKLIKKLGVID